MKLIGNNSGKLKIFLCEDNEEHLSKLVETVEFAATEKGLDISLTSFFTADELLTVLENDSKHKNLVPDVIFADIEMPGMNGIQLGKKINHMFPECYFIFTTAFEEYAVQGYETRAYRYLLKPITAHSVGQVLEQILREKGQNKSVLLKEQGMEVIVPLSEIVYINAEDKYTIFHTKEKFYFDKISLKECENQLCRYGFYRIHRKYLINMKHHKKLGKGVVILSGGIELPISKGKDKDYHECFMTLLKEGMLE